MSSHEAASHIITSPDIADGNPWAMYAAAGLAEQQGITAEPMLLDRFSGVVRATHGLMTRFPWMARQYSKSSEAARSGILAGQYAISSSREVYRRIEGKDPKLERPIHWVATQEHAVRGAYASDLDSYGINVISIIVPDSHPKDSAVQAADLQKDRATMYVWNADAYNDLKERGVSVELIKPFLIEGITGSATLPEHGRDVICKTSGSGMPRGWLSQIQRGLATAGENFGVDWAVYAGLRRYDARGSVELDDRLTKLERLCGDIALNTAVIIGFPTELTGVVAEAQAKGAPTRFLSGPPRGQHEVDNMRFLLRHGLLIGELQFSERQKPSVDGVRMVKISDIPEVLGEAKSATPYEMPAGLVGDNDFWFAAGARAT